MLFIEPATVLDSYHRPRIFPLPPSTPCYPCKKKSPTNSKAVECRLVSKSTSDIIIGTQPKIQPSQASPYMQSLWNAITPVDASQLYRYSPRKCRESRYEDRHEEVGCIILSHAIHELYDNLRSLPNDTPVTQSSPTAVTVFSLTRSPSEHRPESQGFVAGSCHNGSSIRAHRQI